MRQFLAVAVLGAILAFSASTALAAEHREPMFNSQPATSTSITSEAGSYGTVAGGGSDSTRWSHQIYEEDRN